MRTSRTMIQVIILLALFTAVGYTVLRTMFHKGYDGLYPGDIAPDFTLTTMDGAKLKLSDTRGKGVILNFWGTYCPPCVKEMPLIEEKYQKYKDRGLTVVAVNVAENKITVGRFANRYGLTYPIALDLKRETIDPYQIGPMPATVFIRPDGTVLPIDMLGKSTNRSVFEGQLTDQVLEDHIQKILP